MTLHVPYDHYDHCCPECGAKYIPYDNVPCPRCGLVEKERFDFIPLAVESLLFNLDRYGTFTPYAWNLSTLADRIMLVLFSIFEKDRLLEDENPFSSIAKQHIDKVDFGDDEYINTHVHEIALAVKERIDARVSR
jgi:hypothetical protein